MAEAPAKGNSGFTLLELLIVITILGLIIAALTSGVRFAGQAWQTQQRRSAGQADLDSVQHVLRELMTSATSFDGDGTSLRFVSTLPAGLARGGLYDIDLHTDADRLVLVWGPHFKGPSQAKITETVLIKDVAGLDLSYFMGSSGWKRVSQENTKTPALIRIALLSSNGRQWPPFVVAPAVDLVPAVAN